MENYEKYKDSGIPWLGMIPEHWEIKRLGTMFNDNINPNSDFAYKRAYRFNYGSVVPKNEIGEESEYRDTYVKYSVVRKNDIVLNGLNLNYDFVSQRVAIVPADGIITSAYIIARPRQSTFADYYVQVLKTMDNMKMFHGMGTGIRLTLSFNELRKQMLPFPPLAEQEAIAAFIESKTLSIDSYVRERERELRLLDELKQAQIAEAVTHGLNPDVKMKDSGIPWIGLIPEHWEMKKLSQIAQEHFISNKKVHHQNLLSLSYGNIVKRNIDATEGLLPASFDTYQIVEEGNIVLRLTDLQNDHKSLRVGLVKEEGIVTSAYVCLNVTNEEMVVPDYLYNLLHTYDIKKMFYSMGGGIRQNLNWQGLKKIDVPVPPLSEQQSIVDFIDGKCDNINSLISELESEIAYLKEYKQRLVADAVTGQMKVF